MNRELQVFIKDALDKGHNRDTIRGKLLEAGWTDSEVTDSLHSFAPVDFSIAVPRPRPYLYAREAFLYLVSFIALYVSAISFAILVFGLVDYSFPDALDTEGRYPSSEQATALASVIVAFPLFLLLNEVAGKTGHYEPGAPSIPCEALVDLHHSRCRSRCNPWRFDRHFGQPAGRGSHTTFLTQGG